jgi:hypothetical protein
MYALYASSINFEKKNFTFTIPLHFWKTFPFLPKYIDYKYSGNLSKASE